MNNSDVGQQEERQERGFLAANGKEVGTNELNDFYRGGWVKLELSKRFLGQGNESLFGGKKMRARNCMGALALGAMLLGVSAYAAPRDGAAVEKQARNTALRTIAGSDAVLRDAASGSAAQGCITFSTIIRQNAGGVTACNVTSGGGSGAANPVL